MKKIFKFILAATFVFFAACRSTEVQIKDDATSGEIVQYAQTAFDEGHTDLALKYYQELLKRYGTDNAVYVEAQYEIAHIYIKKGRKDEAETMLREILALYENSMPGTLPGAFRILAQNDLKKITKEEK